MNLPSTRQLDAEKLAFEVARNQVGPRLPPQDLLLELGTTEAELTALLSDALFTRRVREFVKELTENGTSFALKAQLQAEDLLKTQYRIAKDPDTPPSVAVAAIANTVRWAGLDKRPGDSGDGATGGARISININLAAAGTREKVVTVDADGGRCEDL